MRLRNFVLLCVTILAIGTVNARQLSADEALARINGTTSNNRIKKLARTASMQLAYTAATNGEQHYYVFNTADEQGFVILSADDLVPAVIGYVEGGSFSIDDMPPAMQWYLDGIERQIERSIHTGVPMYTSLKNAADRPTISPMVTTTWGQSDPYNMLCPTVSGADGPSPSGCVATSMAQVMNFHKWPAKGKGTVNYISKTNSVHISEDLSSVSYDWGHMVDHYGYYYTEGVNNTWKKVTVSSGTTQKLAVAQLMYHCGIATSADYKASSTAIATSNIPVALYNNFSYDAGLHDLQRTFFSDEEWETLVYNELATGRPLIYGGTTDGGSGHSFVFDGYKEGYFHINWGWNGRPDGWFLITGDDPLRPTYQGVGGSESGHDPFVNSQHMIIGIQKPVEGSVPYASIIAKKGVTVMNSDGTKTVSKVEKGVKYKVSGTLTTKSNGKASFTLGVAMTSLTTGKITYISSSTINDVATDKTYSAFYFTVPSGMADDKYAICPVFKNLAESNPQWQPVLYPNDMDYPTVQIGSLSVTMTEPGTTYIDGTQYYTIGSVGELYWFANEVNANKNNTINAVLTADIVVNDSVLDSDGTANSKLMYDWTPIGQDTNYKYGGIFDGKGHTISGLYYAAAGTVYYKGLFGRCDGATIRNVGLLDSYLESTNYAASISGFAKNTTFLNCYSTATVTLTGTTDNAPLYIGGLCAQNSGSTFTNCYFAGKIVADAATSTDHVRNISTSGTIKNCYYLVASATTSAEATGTTPVTASDFKSGKVTYMLNEGKTENVTWYQSIGRDNFPVLISKGNDTVYAGYKNCSQATPSYANTPLNETPGHQGPSVNGFINCEICGKTGYETPQMDADGYYLIANAGNLYWFADMVNANSHTDACARLTADIVINEHVLNADGSLNGTPERQWTPIGKSSSLVYSGTFDGQGHTISGLYYKGTSTRIGLFGTLAGTVKNVGLVDSYLTTDKQIIGGICGLATNLVSNGTEVAVASIQNCYNAATIYSNFTGSTPGMGGICGWIKLETPDTGTASKVTISNCYGRGSVSTSHDTKTYVNGVLGYSPASAVNIVNSYTLTSVATVKFSTGKTAAEFANGSVTASLNGGATTGLWAQNIAEEPFPTFGSDGITYARGTSGDKWAALCLPFDITVAGSSMKYYEVTGTDGNNLNVKELEQEAINGGTPFMVNVEGLDSITIKAADGTAYALTATDGNGLCGTISGEDINSGFYLDGDLFVNVAGYLATNGHALTLAPFTAYYAGTGITADALIITADKPLLGDANNDGEVNIGDFTAIANYILGERNPNFNTAVADVNNDGDINVGDLTALANIILSGGN